jgi:hypothetical protein
MPALVARIFAIDGQTKTEYGACATEKAWLTSEPGCY